MAKNNTMQMAKEYIAREQATELVSSLIVGKIIPGGKSQRETVMNVVRLCELATQYFLSDELKSEVIELLRRTYAQGIPHEEKDE